MTRIYIIFFLLIFSLGAFSQSIRGRILDSASRLPLMSVTVSLHQLDSAVVKRTISDSLGYYNIEGIVAGSYFIKYSTVGHLDYFSGMLIVKDSPATELPEVILRPDPNQLKAVTVVGRRPVLENKIDGITYNASSDIAIAGGNASDVLKRIPLVNIDQNGNLSIAGKNSVRVYIDNKPSDVYASTIADALKQVPSEEIDKVEVITSPSSKYEAEGADAVINIITKKSKYNGTNGSLRSEVKRFQKNLNFGLRVRKNSWAYNVDAGAYASTWRGVDQVQRNDQNTQRPTQLFQSTRFGNKYWSYYAGIGITKVIDSLKTFNIGFRFRDGSFARHLTVYNNFTVKDITSSLYYRDLDFTSKNMGRTVNAGYTAKSADKKNELNLLAVFFDYNGTDDYDLDQTRNDIIDYREISRGKMDNREFSLQADDLLKLNAKSSIEAGVKATFRYFGFDSRIGIFNFSNTQYEDDPIRSNKFAYNRGIYAGYFNYNFQVKKWEFRVGLRYELTTLDTEFKDTSLSIPNYSNPVPNILISRKLDNNNSIRFSYRKNIMRPYLQNLNPNINYMDSLNISYGNPYLLPSIQNGFQFVHSYTKKSYYWNNTLFFNHNPNTIENIRRVRPDGITENTYQNVGKFFDAGIISSLALNRQLGFGFNVSFTLRYVNIKSEALKQSTDGFTYNTNINLFYRFNKSFGIEAYTRLGSRTIFLQGTETRWKQHAITVSKKFFNEKLNISAGMDDFLSPYQKIRTTTRSGALEQYNVGYYPARMFRIGVSYTFGKKDLSIPQTRQASGDE